MSIENYTNYSEHEATIQKLSIVIAPVFVFTFTNISPSFGERQFFILILYIVHTHFFFLKYNYCVQSLKILTAIQKSNMRDIHAYQMVSSEELIII